MNDDESRSLPPTQRRIADALARGQCARSPVAVSAFSIAAMCTLVSGVPSGVAAWRTAFDSTVRSIAAGHIEPHELLSNAFATLESTTTWIIVAIAWAAATSAALAAAQACGRLSFATGAFRVQPARLAIGSGLTRLVKPDFLGAIVGGVGAIATAYVAYVVARSWSQIFVGDHSFTDTFALLGAAIADLWRRTAIAALVLAAADIIIQRRRFRDGLRMTPRELKEERAETDGRPEVKARRRGVAAKRARDVRIAAIKRATAVVTNPSHIAVALRYAPPDIDVPVVVARGADLRAGIVRGGAENFGVPIVESPELARMLYAQVELDAAIPEACYTAVAAIFAWIIRTRGALAGAESDAPQAT
ncbi:MAG TPA: EscU/YscU/HrcU family type III secretion system export apparatus switch protein [Candidatus Eremiobacteraceae bacterium]|nr:EscU/YscU/HrcU family type III secretion system export apparatus switch protein [Candidatus Eremiobacteraceae bacterium]